ncbi:MAG TPA: glycosyltransferase [Thermoanaerobaculia bacterium]
MRILQIVTSGASEYERKSQRIDHAALSETCEMIVASPDDAATVTADLAHVYLSKGADAGKLSSLAVPLVSSIPLPPPRWSWRKRKIAQVVVSPLRSEELKFVPEAVEQTYWESAETVRRERGEDDVRVVGSYFRPNVMNMIEQTLLRAQRFRSDVIWKRFSHPPRAADLRAIDLWVDPTGDYADLDGFVAEAMVAGLPVIATRTPINSIRTENGRTGILVPIDDPNELTHAILTALFKPETVTGRQQAALQTLAKFKPRQRLRALVQLYRTLIP